MDENTISVNRVRLRLIDLIKSFFVSQPDAERLSRWRGTFAALTQEQISPGIDQTVTTLNGLLNSKKLEQIQEEFYALFTDPFSENHVNLMASHYFDGRNYGDTLVGFRQLLKEAQIVKAETVTETEDSLQVMFDALATMIEKDKEGQDTATLQARLILEFLLPFASALDHAAQQNQAADFYAGCIAFCKDYAELEKDLFSAPS